MPHVFIEVTFVLCPCQSQLGTSCKQHDMLQVERHGSELEKNGPEKVMRAGGNGVACVRICAVRNYLNGPGDPYARRVLTTLPL